MTSAARSALVAQLPWVAIGVAALIAGLGIYNLSSAAAAREPDLYLTQFLIFGLGTLVVAVALVPDYRASEGSAYPLYAIVCLLLVAVLVQGDTAGGATRWLMLGPIRFQPSELAKVAVIFGLARYFSQRLEPGGYSMRSLLRPLNPSRPAAAMLILIVTWDADWLKDPVGSLARFLYTVVDSPTPVAVEGGALRWFVVASILVLAGSALAMVHRFDTRQVLLHPWPPARRRRLNMLILISAVAALAALSAVWRSPWLVDPLGMVIATLVEGAEAGGPYTAVASAPLLRGLALVAVLVYGVVSYRHWEKHRPSPVDWLIAPIDLVVLPAFLILIEPDLGTAGIIVLIGFTMILVVGVRLRSFIILAFSGIALALVSWFGVLKDYQKRRILTFMDPEGDIQGAGWNAIQSMIAVGSGRFWGKGHREGTQTQLSFLPEQHTDFAFSVWAEEQGFLGCLLLLALFVTLVLFALNAASEAREPYGALLAVGVGALVFWQTVINVGMVIGLLPVVGMTLPLFSYGGSSLLTVLFCLGVVFSIHLRRRAY